MYTTLHCIALRTIKHNERNNILTVFSQENGRISFLIPAINSKAARRQRALTMPMSAFECVACLKPGRELHTFHSLTTAKNTPAAGFTNPARSAIAFFLADFFSTILREPIAENSIYNLLADTVQLLWSAPSNKISNLHLLTLARTAMALGIFPDITTWQKGRYFDMVDGIWQNLPPSEHRHIIGLAESSFAAKLTRINAENFHKYRFTRYQRNNTLDLMLQYFALHGFGNAKCTSLEVLRELF